MKHSSGVAAPLLGVIGLVAGGACQVHDFEQTSPLTVAQSIKVIKVHSKRHKPNLWLLVDTSASMAKADMCDGATCTSRLAALRAGMHPLLSQSGSAARMALTFFPGAGDSCAPANSVAVGLPAPTADDEGTSDTLTAHAALIEATLSTATANGGTPTGSSVAFVGTQPGLLNDADGRDDYVLLLTDGLPNCNDANEANICSCYAQNTCQPNASGCRCTVAEGAGCASPSLCARGCLDQVGTAAQIAALRKKGVRTVVVAFGPDATSTDAAQTLEAMATAGDAHPRTCSRDSDCGNDDTCTLPEGWCRHQYYRANNAAELAGVLRVPEPPPTCTFNLDEPPDYIAVLVNQEDVPAGPTTWSYDKGAVVFVDSSPSCIALKEQRAGMEIEIRYVRKL